MPTELYEFHPAARLSVGALGRPGQRVFLLQVAGEERLLTMKLEKQQAAALASGIDTLLDELEKNEGHAPSGQAEPAPLVLRQGEERVEVEFVVGHMGLGYDAAENRIILVIHEMQAEDDAAPEDEAAAQDEAALEDEAEPEGGTQGVEVRVWAALAQMRALSRQAKEVVAQGRPICPLCQQPMDPDGHFCPRRNGHHTHAAETGAA